MRIAAITTFALSLACGSAYADMGLIAIPENLRPSVVATLASITADDSKLTTLSDAPELQLGRPAIALLARALKERMHFRFDEADSAASKCLSVARDTHDDITAEQCGLLRLALARTQLDLGKMERRAEEIQAIIDRASIAQGKTRAALNEDADASYQWTIEHFRSLKGLPPATLRRQGPGPFVVPIEYAGSTAPLAHVPRVRLTLNGREVIFALDTGSYFSIIPAELARRIGVKTTAFLEPVSDLTGKTRLYKTALVKNATIGGLAIRNLPVLVDARDVGQVVAQPQRMSDTPILGMDLLLFLQEFEISKKSLTIFPGDRGCTSDALFSGEMDPTIADVFLVVDTNNGPLKTLLDTGFDQFAGASFLHKDAYHLTDLPSSGTTSLALGMYGGVQGRTVDIPVSLLIQGETFKRVVKMESALQKPSEMQLGTPSMEDFSFYYDLERGRACMSPIGPE